jgi:archaellum biogenesis ATPase FlaH
MYRKEMNELSPMRVFEKSLCGGLGRGKLGVVVAPSGIGKTALLVHIALDDLLRDRRVLHISYAHGVDDIRAYYSAIFHDLSESSRLDDADTVQVDIEQHRLIFSLSSHADNAPPSQRGGRTSVSKLLEVVGFARTYAHFEPDVVIVDGFELGAAGDQGLAALRQLAQELHAEVWISMRADDLPLGSARLPESLEAHESLVDVVVSLRPAHDAVHLRLLKDHERKNLNDLELRLDPHTLRLLDENVEPGSERRRDPRQFRLVSGGSIGAEAEFGACAERWGMSEVNYSFEGHRALERRRGVRVLDEAQLKRGDFSLVYVSRRLGRSLSDIPRVRDVLRTIWHQVTEARQVFMIGMIQQDGTLRGGTGWGAELARLWNKPLFVFDQQKRAWFTWNGSAWEFVGQPTITREVFAGIGTQQLNDDGKTAIHDLFVRSFGAAPKSSVG